MPREPNESPLPLMSERFLRRLEYLFLIARHAHPGPLPALRSTSLYGHGLEFADHQPYLPGDDLRYLDWNVYARHGHLLLKRFQEERDLRVDILLDASRSMRIGRPSKFSFATRVAAALAYMGLAGLDRVALTVFADRVLEHAPPVRGKNQIMSILRFLARQQPVGTDTNLEAATLSVCRRPEAGGIAILISDFFDAHGFQRALDRLRYRRFEIYLLQVLSADEENPTWRGDVELVDVESGERRPLVISERLRKEYRRSFVAYQQELRTYARQNGLGFLATTTQVADDHLLLNMMRHAQWLSGA